MNRAVRATRAVGAGGDVAEGNPCQVTIPDMAFGMIEGVEREDSEGGSGSENITFALTVFLKDGNTVRLGFPRGQNFSGRTVFQKINERAFPGDIEACFAFRSDRPECREKKGVGGCGVGYGWF